MEQVKSGVAGSIEPLVTEFYSRVLGYLRLEEAAFVESSLLKVNESYREAMILRYLQDLSLNEIALALEIPEGTVKSRLSRGLKELKVIMEKGGGLDA